MCMSNPFKKALPNAVIKASQDQAQQIPIRQPVLLPDNGDASVVAGLKNRRRLTSSAMILSANGGSLGAPNVATPLGTSGL